MECYTHYNLVNYKMLYTSLCIYMYTNWSKRKRCKPCACNWDKMSKFPFFQNANDFAASLKKTDKPGIQALISYWKYIKFDSVTLDFFPKNLWSSHVQREDGDPWVHLLSLRRFASHLQYCIMCSRERYIHVFINDTSSLFNCPFAAMSCFPGSILTEVLTYYRIF